ncbi:uncharacterized protein LOC111632954 [Centruroides sculpturatus]|uniref:uncharacterized protein LOC111632954 n=1 Tax=Centruroides sculpturatus TaxID=218467 RepID=UPI000C6CAB66|nr:uncharacterized protein LOC111632954 [Centruroides sculpturatus]
MNYNREITNAGSNLREKDGAAMNRDLIIFGRRIERKLEQMDAISSRVEDAIDNLTLSRMFERKFWKLFLSFNLFFMPLTVAVVYEYFTFDENTNLRDRMGKKILSTFLLAISMVAGLPFYLYQLGQVEKLFR